MVISMCKRGKIRKKISVMVLSLLLLGCSLGSTMTVAADENVTVTEAKAVLYSVKGTSVYNYPDLNATVVTTIQANAPVEVLGVTSNGWFQVNINGKYYIPGSGLVATQSQAISTVTAYDDVSIASMIKGTFSYYENAKLRAFTVKEVQEMDENTYLKYLDSFLKGNAMIDYCIMQDSGLVLKQHFEGKQEADASLTNKTMKEYLVDYRMDYLNKSLSGLARTKRGLCLILNRAIRYDRNEVTTVYKNASIGSDSDKMEELLKEVVAEMKEEQGVTFTYKKSYGSYTTENGGTASGWNITFTQTK